MPVEVERPRTCLRCGNISVDADHWGWWRKRDSGVWVCKIWNRHRALSFYHKSMDDREVAERHRARDRSRYESRKMKARLNSYAANDRKRFGCRTVSWDIAEQLMLAECSYCGIAPSGGLDRIDPREGHHEFNVLPCCAVCNSILSDLPGKSKRCVADFGLKEARRRGLLSNWDPPQKRPEAKARQAASRTRRGKMNKDPNGDGTTSASEKACMQCGATPLTYMEGCASCRACGWSKC